MHGGFAMCKLSLYSAKFFVLSMSFRIDSRVAWVFWWTWSQVLFRRAIGAVPRAEMMDVMVEKLFSWRHFCTWVG